MYSLKFAGSNNYFFLSNVAFVSYLSGVCVHTQMEVLMCRAACMEVRRQRQMLILAFHSETGSLLFPLCTLGELSSSLELSCPPHPPVAPHLLQSSGVRVPVLCSWLLCVFWRL